MNTHRDEEDSYGVCPACCGCGEGQQCAYYVMVVGQNDMLLRMILITMNFGTTKMKYILIMFCISILVYTEHKAIHGESKIVLGGKQLANIIEAKVRKEPLVATPTAVFTHSLRISA